MKSPTLDLRTLAIGLLGGVCLMLARGAANPDSPIEQRYQISITSSQQNGTTNSRHLAVLDHKDNTIRFYDWSATQWRVVDQMQTNAAP